MKKLETYLHFNGTCAEAMRFYEKTLGGKATLLPAKDAPDPSIFGPGNADKIMHSKLETDDAILMASDWLASDPYPGMSGFYVTLSVPTAEEGKRLFDTLAGSGRVHMPYGKTFYSDGFGMCVDRFGTPWMVMAETNSQTTGS
jgi:PhnB protein